MPPSNWDHRPKNRARHVAAPPRRRPIIRLLLLAGVGMGLYFGFEPLSRQFSGWMKKPSSPKTPTTKPAPDPLDVHAAKVSIPEFKSKLSFGAKESAEAPSKDGVDSGFTWSYRRSAASSRDSSEIILHCQAGSDQACLDAIEARRPGLSPWLAQALGQDAGGEPMAWQAIFLRDIDSSLSDAALASLVQLTLRQGKGRASGRPVTYRPMRTARGMRLCPTGGCPEAAEPRLPVGSMAGVQSDVEEQALRLSSVLDEADTSANFTPTPTPTALIAPAAGWVARRDTVASKPPHLRLAIDHAQFARTEFSAPLGAMTLAAEMRPGQAVKAGQKVGTATGELGAVTITWLKQGSPQLPNAWAVHPPGDSLAP